MSTEVAKKGSTVPALANTPALDLGVEDVAFSRIYVGQFMSQHVKDGLVPAGSIFAALDTEDPEPVVLYKGDGATPVRFHILGLRRGKSTSVDGELVRYDYNDPDAPPNAWTTYNYVVALPSLDVEVPFKWLLTRSGQPTARRINTALVRAQPEAPWSVAWDATTVYKQKGPNEWYVPQARHVEADKADLEICEAIASRLPSDVEVVDAPDATDEPAI